MTTVAAPSTFRAQPPVQQQTKTAASAGEVARTYAEHASKKALSVLHIPEKLSDTASVVSLQDSNLRAQKLEMQSESSVSGGLYKKQQEANIGRLVLSTKESDKKHEQSRLLAARQEDTQLAARRLNEAQVVAACEAYRVMQRSDYQVPLSRKNVQPAGGIISTLA